MMISWSKCRPLNRSCAEVGSVIPGVTAVRRSFQVCTRTLLGSYLTDAFDGDIRRRDEVSTRLAHDVRQGAHARKVMESYQAWFGEGPELSVLRMLGLFD